MTLTGSLPADAVPPIVDGLPELYDEHVGASVTQVDAGALYVEEDPATGFRIVDRFVFARRRERRRVSAAVTFEKLAARAKPSVAMLSFAKRLTLAVLVSAAPVTARERPSACLRHGAERTGLRVGWRA